MFPEKDKYRGVANGFEPLAAWCAFQARARPSSMLSKSPGSSGEGLASEPRHGIFHPFLSRLKRWRESPAEGLNLPSSPSFKSPAVRRSKIDKSYPEGQLRVKSHCRKKGPVKRQGSDLPEAA